MLIQIVPLDSDQVFAVIAKCPTCLIVTRSKLNQYELQQGLASGELEYVCTWCGRTRKQTLDDNLKHRITEIVHTV